MEGRVHVPVASETAGEPSCSVSASSETPRQGLGRAIPSPPRPRPGSSRILVASASIAPLAGRPIRVSIPSYAYVSHDWQGMAKRAMGRRSNHLFTIPYRRCRDYGSLRTTIPHFFTGIGYDTDHRDPCVVHRSPPRPRQRRPRHDQLQHPLGLGTPPGQESTRHGMSPTVEAILTRRQQGLLRLQQPRAWPA